MHVTSAPICALIPVFIAARWKRGEPYTPSRSSNAIAGIPRFAHTAISSSGTEAPSRKLKAEREWSSTYIGSPALSSQSAALGKSFRLRTENRELRTFSSHTSLLQTSFHSACLALSDTTRGPVSADTAMSHSSRDQPSCSDQSPEDRQGPAVQTISPAMSSRSGQRIRTGFASRTVTLAPSGGRNRPQGNYRAHFFLCVVFRAMHCRFPAWAYRSSSSVGFQTASFQVPQARSAAPQTRLRDVYPVIPPTPLFFRRQCARCVPESAPAFPAREKSAETIHSAEHAGAPDAPTNESSRWALAADSPANQAAIISEKFSHPAWASAAAKCEQKCA